MDHFTLKANTHFYFLPNIYIETFARITQNSEIIYPHSKHWSDDGLEKS